MQCCDIDAGEAATFGDDSPTQLYVPAVRLESHVAKTPWKSPTHYPWMVTPPTIASGSMRPSFVSRESLVGKEPDEYDGQNVQTDSDRVERLPLTDRVPLPPAYDVAVNDRQVLNDRQAVNDRQVDKDDHQPVYDPANDRQVLVGPVHDPANDRQVLVGPVHDPVNDRQVVSPLPTVPAEVPERNDHHMPPPLDTGYVASPMDFVKTAPGHLGYGDFGLSSVTREKPIASPDVAESLKNRSPSVAASSPPSRVPLCPCGAAREVDELESEASFRSRPIVEPRGGLFSACRDARPSSSDEFYERPQTARPQTGPHLIDTQRSTTGSWRELVDRDRQTSATRTIDEPVPHIMPTQKFPTIIEGNTGTWSDVIRQESSLLSRGNEEGSRTREDFQQPETVPRRRPSEASNGIRRRATESTIRRPSEASVGRRGSRQSETSNNKTKGRRTGFLCCQSGQAASEDGENYRLPLPADEIEKPIEKFVGFKPPIHVPRDIPIAQIVSAISALELDANGDGTPRRHALGLQASTAKIHALTQNASFTHSVRRPQMDKYTCQIHSHHLAKTVLQPAAVASQNGVDASLEPTLILWTSPKVGVTCPNKEPLGLSFNLWNDGLLRSKLDAPDSIALRNSTFDLSLLFIESDDDGAMTLYNDLYLALPGSSAVLSKESEGFAMSPFELAKFGGKVFVSVTRVAQDLGRGGDLRGDLDTLYRSQAFGSAPSAIADVTIVCERDVIPATRAVLMARSTVFRQMLEGKSRAVIAVTGAPPEVVRSLIDFIHTDRCDKLSNLHDLPSTIRLFETAVRFAVPALANDLALRLAAALSPSNFHSINAAAAKTKHVYLMEAVQAYVCEMTGGDATGETGVSALSPQIRVTPPDLDKTL